MERLGDYELLEPLGRGAAGVVMRARNVRSGHEVALKLLVGTSAGEAQLKRFEREVEAMRRLAHPNVVRVVEAGVVQGRRFIAMELVEGPSLASVMVERGPFAPGEAVELVRKLARALQHAHEQGVLHRDIKPGNVLLSPQAEPLLSDFGLARALTGSSFTTAGQTMGTPGYAAPELVRGAQDRVGPATDVYGLGATLYALLTGLPPIRGDTYADVLSATVERAPTPPSRLRPGIEPGLEQIVLRCLAKEPEGRPASAEGLARELEGWLAGGRSRPGLAVPVGLALLLLLTGGLAARRVLAPAARANPAPAASSSGPAASSPAPAPEPSAEELVREAKRLLDSAPARAAEESTRAIEKEPARAEAWYVRASARGRLNDLQGALQDLDRTIELAPGAPVAWLRRGSLQLELGALPRANADLSRAIELASGPSPGPAWDLPHQRVLAVALQKRGVARLQWDRSKSLQDFERSIELAPDDPEGWNQRGLLRTDMGDPGRGFADISKAIELAPGNAVYWLNRSYVGVDAEQMIADATRAIELGEPGTYVVAIAHFNRGNGLRDKGDLERALEDYTRASQLSPGNPAPLNNRGIVHRRRGDFARAIQDHTRAIELEPRDAVLWLMRGLDRGEAGDWAGALADHERALELAPDLAHALMARGQARLELGDVARATADLERASKLFPHDGELTVETRRLLERARSASR